MDEWELSDRNADYLLTGSRLNEFETWSREGSLQLTTREREFLEAGLRCTLAIPLTEEVGRMRDATAEEAGGQRDDQR